MSGPSNADSDDGNTESLSLKEALAQTQSEARMVLPGVQAIFGFQLIAVFNERFAAGLDSREQLAHLVALLLVGLAGHAADDAGRLPSSDADPERLGTLAAAVLSADRDSVDSALDRAVDRCVDRQSSCD